MKKLIPILVLIFALCGAWGSAALADWSITVTWTRSVGPDLDYEEVISADVVKCTIQEIDVTSCNWTQTTISGEQVKIISYNNSGVPSDPYNVGTLTAPQPASATGGSITIQWVP